MINAMHKDVLKEVRGLRNDIVQDSPFDVIHFLSQLRKKWYKIFTDKAKQLVRWLVGKISNRTRQQILDQLQSLGFDIKPYYSEDTQQIIRDLIGKNVDLIKSIPQKYLRQVQKIIYDAYLKGEDVDKIAERIEKLIDKKAYPNAKRRAYLIAKDQINKITQQMALEEAKALGATKGNWIHRPGEFSSRETHIAMNGHEFDLNVGLYDPDVNKYVLPAELPYCCCTFVAVFPGME